MRASGWEAEKGALDGAMPSMYEERKCVGMGTGFV